MKGVDGSAWKGRGNLDEGSLVQGEGVWGAGDGEVRPVVLETPLGHGRVVEGGSGGWVKGVVAWGEKGGAARQWQMVFGEGVLRVGEGGRRGPGAWCAGGSGPTTEGVKGRWSAWSARWGSGEAAIGVGSLRGAARWWCLEPRLCSDGQSHVFPEGRARALASALQRSPGARWGARAS